MIRYVCTTCGYTYDDQTGLPELGIVPGTPFVDLPDDWCCPECGAPKEEFREFRL
jgi:rubredoxin